MRIIFDRATPAPASSNGRDFRPLFAVFVVSQRVSFENGCWPFQIALQARQFSRMVKA
jgi:hypothetical protein